MRVRSIYRVSHKIVERALTYREDHLPAMDGAAVAGERHALVEGFIALRAGEHEVKLTLRDEVEDRSCIVLLHAGAAILGERRSGPVVGGEDVQLGAAVAGAKDADIFVPRPDVVAKIGRASCRGRGGERWWAEGEEEKQTHTEKCRRG